MASFDWNDMRAFASVARARSFRGAASIGGGSASTLSEAVRRLEAQLDIRLLNRTTRSVTPTEAGARLLDRLLPALAEMEAAVDELAGPDGEPAGTLRLNVPSFVARVILPPILARFLAAHPSIRVEVRAEDIFRDVVEAGFDAGIRYEERMEQDMIAVPIGPRMQRFVTAASPEYLTAHPAPCHPHDLLRHKAIRHRFASGAMPDWEYERNGEILRVSPPARAVGDTVDLELSLALAGLGVIATFEEVLLPALESGALIRLLPEWEQVFSGPLLYFPSRRHMPPPLRAFVDFIRADAVRT